MKPRRMRPGEIWNEIQSMAHNELLSAMADAVAECRTACDMDTRLTQKGRQGLLRILELVFETNLPGCVAGADFITTDTLANMLALLYVQLIFDPLIGTRGLYQYGELLRMMGELMAGEWFA